MLVSKDCIMASSYLQVVGKTLFAGAGFLDTAAMASTLLLGETAIAARHGSCLLDSSLPQPWELGSYASSISLTVLQVAVSTRTSRFRVQSISTESKPRVHLQALFSAASVHPKEFSSSRGKGIGCLTPSCNVDTPCRTVTGVVDSVAGKSPSEACCINPAQLDNAIHLATQTAVGSSTSGTPVPVGIGAFRLFEESLTGYAKTHTYYAAAVPNADNRQAELEHSHSLRDIQGCATIGYVLHLRAKPMRVPLTAVGARQARSSRAMELETLTVAWSADNAMTEQGPWEGKEFPLVSLQKAKGMHLCNAILSSLQVVICSSSLSRRQSCLIFTT